MSNHDAPDRSAAPSVNSRVVFSFGVNTYDADPRQQAAASFADFAAFVCENRSEKKGGRYFCAPFSANGDGKHHRCKDGTLPRRFLPLDLDHIESGETLNDLMRALQPWRHFAYTTASSTADKPRLRVVVELSREVTRVEGIRCGLAFQRDLLEAAGLSNNAVKFDEAVYRGEQPCYGPLTRADVYPRDQRITGAAADVEALLAKAPELAPDVTAVDRAGRIIDTDPRIQHLYDSGCVLKANTLVGKLAIRCPNASAHSHETGPTSTVVLLPHFNGVAEAAIKCLHASCANISQAEFWRLTGYAKPDDAAAAAVDEIQEGGLFTMARSLPDTEFVISPILPRGQLGTITGHPGSGKTTLFVGMYVAAALDRSLGPLTRRGDGLFYIVSAEDFEGTRDRALAESIRHRLTPEQEAIVERQVRWVTVPRIVSPSVIFAKIEERRVAQPVAHIFVDTGPALFPGDDENDAVQLRDYINGLAKLLGFPGRPGVTAAWHPTKSATRDRLLPRGAGAIGGSTSYNLTAWNNEDATVTLHHTKLRSRPFDELRFTVELVELPSKTIDPVSAPILRYIELDDDGNQEQRMRREAVLLALNVDRPPGVRQLAKQLGASPATAYRDLKDLVGRKLVEKDALDDEQYTLTKAGRERVRGLRASKDGA